MTKTEVEGIQGKILSFFLCHCIKMLEYEINTRELIHLVSQNEFFRLYYSKVEFL